MADTTTYSTRTRKLLAPLRGSILKKPHYISGKLQLTTSCFSLFYKLAKDGCAARHIDLANATLNDLEELAQACQSPTLRVVEQDVTNELHCNVRKMDLECFAPRLAPDQTSLVKLIENYLFEFESTQSKIKTELHELNVYTQGSFSKPRIETPRGKNMIGSLVIVFPTPHEGGALLARHCGQEWSFDPSSFWEFTTARTTKIGYVVLFNNVEHEVTPVTSGHRVTLTYNLYRVDGSAPARDSVEDHFSVPNHGRAFRESFEALLENPEFFPYGGTLAFGLRHGYPIEREIRHVYDLLKANDAMVYRSLRTLGFQPALYLYYEWNSPPWFMKDNTIEGGLIDRVIEFEGFNSDEPGEVDVTREILHNGGHVVCGNDLYRLQEKAYQKAETMEWATPMTRFSSKEKTYTTYGNEPMEEVAYWDLCLVVRIGKAGERFMYPTLSQLKREKERDKFLVRETPFWNRMYE